MRKTSQDAGDSMSITSGMDGDHRRSGPGLIKSTRNSIKRRVQSLSHESDDAVIEPLLQKDKPETSTSAKFLTKSKTEEKRKDSLRSTGGSGMVSVSSVFSNGVKDNQMIKTSHTTASSSGSSGHPALSARSIVTTSSAPVKTQVLIDIDGHKPFGSNTSNPLIFTTAKIHADGKSKQMEPVLVTPMPILSTVESSSFKPRSAETSVPIKNYNVIGKFNASTALPSVTSVVATTSKSDLNGPSNMASMMKPANNIDLVNSTGSNVIKVSVNTPSSIVDTAKSTTSNITDSKLGLTQSGLNEKNIISNASANKSDVLSTLGPSNVVENDIKQSNKTIMLDSIEINSKLDCPLKTGKEMERLSEKELISAKTKDFIEINRLENEVCNTDINKNFETKSSILSKTSAELNKQSKSPLASSSASSSSKDTSISTRSDTSKLQRQKQNVDESIHAGKATAKVDKPLSKSINKKDEEHITSAQKSNENTSKQDKTKKSSHETSVKVEKDTAKQQTVSPRSSIKIMNVAITPKSEISVAKTVSGSSHKTPVSAATKKHTTTISTSDSGSKNKPESSENVHQAVTKSIPTTTTNVMAKTKSSEIATSKTISSNISKTTTAPSGSKTSNVAPSTAKNAVTVKAVTSLPKATTTSVVKSVVGTAISVSSSKTVAKSTSTISTPNASIVTTSANGTKATLNKSVSGEDKKIDVKDSKKTKA